MILSDLLGAVARHGRLCLVLGLLAGLALPSLAAALRPWLGELVALLLFLTAFRVGHREALGSLRDLPRVLTIVGVLQLAAPLIAGSALAWAGLLNHPFALAVVLMLAAPSVSGAPNFLIMTGGNPAHAMRILVVGTALFPLTVLPVLWLLPASDGAVALAAAGRLILVILLAVCAGFAARAWVAPVLKDAVRSNLDGVTAIALAVIVIGLMSAIGPLARSDPARLLLWLGAVIAVNFGLQIASYGLLRRVRPKELAAISIISGNRNIALFLIALPEEMMAPLLIFIGCYQVPMYLTPVLLKRLHRD